MVVIDNKALIPPAEWEEHKAIWTAWPTGEDLWAPDPKFAREEVAAMIRALSENLGGRCGDKVKLLVKNEEAKISAQEKSWRRCRDYITALWRCMAKRYRTNIPIC